MKSILNTFNLILFSVTIINCAGETDYSIGPGICKIDCSQAILASNDMRIRFFFEDVNLATEAVCRAPGVSYSENFSLRFVIEKPRASLPAEVGRSETVGSTFPEAGDQTQWVPVSGVEFYPMRLGGWATQREESLPDLDYLTGIMTPEREWCTDSCGVGTLLIKPDCPFGGTAEEPQSTDTVIGILSGSLNDSATFTLHYPLMQGE